MYLYTVEMNECQTSNNCDVNAVCTDLETGYMCTCRLGYIGNGTRCIKSSKWTFSIHDGEYVYPILVKKYNCITTMIFLTNTTVYPAVVSTPIEGQVCLSDDQHQNTLNRVRSDIRSILGSSNSTIFTMS